MYNDSNFNTGKFYIQIFFENSNTNFVVLNLQLEKTLLLFFEIFQFIFQKNFSKSLIVS